MRAIHFNFLIIIVFNCTYSFGQFNPQQQKRLDSLGKILNNPESHDTSKAETCVKLSEMLYTSNNDTLKPLCKKAKAISEKGLINPENEAVEGKFLYILSHAYNNLGYINSREGNTDSAFYYYEKSIEVQEKIHDTLGVANTYNNMAFIYYQQGKIPKALELFHESLKLKEQLKELKTLSHAYSNIGAIHRDLQNDSLALYYYKKGLKLRKQVGDKRGVSNSYNNIAVMMKDIQHGIDFHKKALQIRIEINNEPGIASSYNNIGNAYIKLGNLEKAEEHVSKSLPISYRIGSKKGIASSKNLLAKIYFLQKKFKKAKQYGEESLALAQETEDVIKIKDASQILSNIYEKMGSGIKALEMYKLQSLMQDSLDGKAAQKASAQEQAKYEYETQKAIDDAEHSKQIIIEQEEKQRQKIISIAVGIGLVLVVLFLVFVFNRLQITKKQKIVIESQKQEVEEQKRLVEHQKDEVEEAHKEITDSINYAERIQRSFLATDDILNENLNEHFVFFQPKEAVSGDFYWAGKLPNNQFAMVNADSTGHGVPGAIMSILNISSIEKAIEKAKDFHKVKSFSNIISVGDGIWDLKTARNLELHFIGIGMKNYLDFEKEKIKVHIKDWNEFDLTQVEQKLGIKNTVANNV